MRRAWDVVCRGGILIQNSRPTAILHLQTRIRSLENAIADRREFYNESVNLNNVRISQFQDLLLARVLGFNREVMLRFACSELKDVDIAARSKQ